MNAAFNAHKQILFLSFNNKEKRMDANEEMEVKTNDSLEEEEMETEENGGKAENEIINDNNFSIQTVSNKVEVRQHYWVRVSPRERVFYPPPSYQYCT